MEKVEGEEGEAEVREGERAVAASLGHGCRGDRIWVGGAVLLGVIGGSWR